MEKHIKFRLFLVVIFVFIGAVIFLSDPFVNKNKTPVYNAAGNILNASADGVIVNIPEEEVATAIPAASGENNRWMFLAVAVTIINLAGSVAIVFITSKDTSQV